MNTLNIALTILCCIIIICNNVIWYKIYRKQQKAFDNYGKNLSKEAAEETKDDLRKTIYGIIGNHFHGIDYILKHIDKSLIPLIEALGEYARGRHWEKAQKGFTEYNQSDPDSDYVFPCLDESQNRQMKVFLREIRVGKREPESLIEFLSLLTEGWSFGDAIINIKQKYPLKPVVVEDTKRIWPVKGFDIIKKAILKHSQPIELDAKNNIWNAKIHLRLSESGNQILFFVVDDKGNEKPFPGVPEAIVLDNEYIREIIYASDFEPKMVGALWSALKEQGLLSE